MYKNIYNMNNNDDYIHCDMCKVKMAKDPTNAITHDDPDEPVDMQGKFTVGTRCDEHGMIYCLECECPLCIYEQKEERETFLNERINELKNRVRRIRKYKKLPEVDAKIRAIALKLLKERNSLTLISHAAP